MWKIWNRNSEDVIEAIYEGDIIKFDSFINRGLDINTITEGDKWNFLHRALVSTNHPIVPKMIKHLVDLGVDVNATDKYLNTPLHYASRIKSQDGVEAIEILLDANAEIDPVNQDGITPLRMSLISKPFNREIISLLLSRGANPNHATKGCSVKQLAEMVSHGDNADIIKLFL